MRFSALAIGLTLLSSSSHAFFVGQPQQRRATTTTTTTTTTKTATTKTSIATRTRENTFCKSLATPSSSSSPSSSSGRSTEEIKAELSSGKVLEGGKVIDFEAVKGPSKAEEALLQARKEILAATPQHQWNGNGAFVGADATTEILGINDDVVREVGHELGQFASSADIQRCAAYLRSLASTGLFKEENREEDGNNNITKEKIRQFQSILSKAYEESGEVTGAFAKTFYMGTMLLPQEAREAIWAVYVWCRRTDEIVDAPREDDSEMLRDLSSWELRLENLWDYGQVQDVYDLCLLDVRIKYPNMDITPYMDMIRGMLMDVPGLGQDRYNTFDELHLYCYRVAGTVGLMSLPIFGCAPGITYEQAREPALSLGVAFQLTNILRDVGEDAVQRGRIYLPRDDMERFGVTEDQIFQQRMDENYIQLMKYEIQQARMYYERARRGVFMLAPESRLPVQSSLDAYGTILDKIEENGYDSLTTRAYVGKWEKLAIIPFSWYRTLDVSRYLPLPGDNSVETL